MTSASARKKAEERAAEQVERQVVYKGRQEATASGWMYRWFVGAQL